MTPASILKSKTDKFRLIFVSQKLEYPKSMLDDLVIISIDDDKCRREKERIILKRMKGNCNSNAEKMQNDLEFIDACFEGNYELVKQSLNTGGLNANTKDFSDNTALMQAALKGHYKI